MTWKNTGGTFEDPPTGTHLARCIRIIDIGTQESEWQGKKLIRRQNVIMWELPTELMQDGEYAGKPFVVTKFYTTSLNPKSNLYADLVNWRGREFTPDELEGFEEKNLLDKVCLLSLTRNDKGKVRATGIMQRPKHMDVPPRVNDLVYFSLEPERFDQATFDSLSQGFKDMIVKSPEYAEIKGGGRRTVAPGPVDQLDDDIPF